MAEGILGGGKAGGESEADCSSERGNEKGSETRGSSRGLASTATKEPDHKMLDVVGHECDERREEECCNKRKSLEEGARVASDAGECHRELRSDG